MPRGRKPTIFKEEKEEFEKKIDPEKNVHKKITKLFRDTDYYKITGLNLDLSLKIIENCALVTNLINEDLKKNLVKISDSNTNADERAELLIKVQDLMMFQKNICAIFKTVQPEATKDLSEKMYEGLCYIREFIEESLE